VNERGWTSEGATCPRFCAIFGLSGISPGSEEKFAPDVGKKRGKYRGEIFI